MQNEKESLKLGKLLRPVIGFMAFVILIWLASNAMPFYSDGTRMGLTDGIPAIIDGARPTAPFGAAAAENVTGLPADRYRPGENPLLDTPAALGQPFGIDVMSAAALALLGIWTLGGILLRGFRIPFVVIHNRMLRRAAKTGVSNKRLNADCWGAILITAAVLLGAVAFLVSFIPIGMEYGADGSIEFTFGMLTKPGGLLFLGIAAVILVKHTAWIRRRYRGLAARRCPRCFALDSYVTRESEDLDTRLMEEKTYDVYSNGNKKLKKSREYVEQDYRLLRECRNCGRRVQSYRQSKEYV